MIVFRKLMAGVLAAGSLLAPAMASPVGGPKYKTERVAAHRTDVFTVTFRGGEGASVVVSGDGDTDLDLYIYDENGNLIGSDTDASDDCVVRFHPRWTGVFRIEVRNLGGVYNQYEIACL